MENVAARFTAQAAGVRLVAEQLLAEWFGPRCEDFCEGCECCERYKALDRLTRNDFRDDLDPEHRKVVDRILEDWGGLLKKLADT